MAEFQFSCPQCRQAVQCDAGYAGTRINCPICQLSIVVPPAGPQAASGRQPIMPIIKSGLKISGIILICILLVIAAIDGAVRIIAGPKAVTIRAYVDGTDVVKIRGRQLWIEHLTWQQPSKISINGVKWNPVWNETSTPTMPTWTDNATDPYALKRAFSPGNPDRIKLSQHRGRGSVTLMETPTPDNQETLAIQVDDGPYAGADWYEFTVAW